MVTFFKGVAKFVKRVVRKFVKPLVIYSFTTAIEIIMIIPCFCISIVARDFKRDIDVGLGPEALINNVYHKKALMQAGYTAETFVNRTFFITDEFDLDLSRWREHALLKRWIPYYLFFRTLFRYRVLFMYFNGGAFLTAEYPFSSKILRALEPLFYKLANVKTVVMPYGGDVQVLTRSPNLYFKHAFTVDYPGFRKTYRRNRKNIDRWTCHADWIISGCEWVDYMYHWDTLMLAHFSIDTQRWMPPEKDGNAETSKLRILHAPNHTMIKGTDALIAAVELLKSEGLEIELVLLQGVPNDEIRRAMTDADLVADQFVIGWYAMFALEAMAMEKPVLCYLRQDLIELYVHAGLVAEDEIPLINTNLRDIAAKIRWAYENREELRAIGKKGRGFVQKHHSTESVGGVFSNILNGLGIKSGKKGAS